MEFFDKNDAPLRQNRARNEPGWQSGHLLVIIEDPSLEGVGISAGEEVLIEEWEEGETLSAERHAGALLCFANRHGELVIGRYAPPYIELPYRDKTYRIGIGGRRVVGAVIR